MRNILIVKIMLFVVLIITINIFGVGEHIPTKIFREYAEILNQD